MAAAGLWTTPTDLAKFAIEVGLAARGKSNKVLSKETAGLMLKPQIAVGGSQEMALGLFLEEHDGEVYYGHGGPGRRLHRPARRQTATAATARPS